jgi:hypothetical protein
VAVDTSQFDETWKPDGTFVTWVLCFKVSDQRFMKSSDTLRQRDVYTSDQIEPVLAEVWDDKSTH